MYEGSNPSRLLMTDLEDVDDSEPLHIGQEILVIYKPTGQPYAAVIESIDWSKTPPGLSIRMPQDVYNEMGDTNVGDWEVVL